MLNDVGVDSVHPLDRIKVPFPIFVASLPKSGTTSTAYYFQCGKIWTAHTFVNTHPVPVVANNGSDSTASRPRQMRVGQCYQENMELGRPPFENCGRYKVFSDAGHPKGLPCFYPSVHGLEAFYNAYPNATIMLMTRNSTAWAASVQQWKSGILLRRWKRCDKFPNRGVDSTATEIQQFYQWHVDTIRQFVADHPSLTYVEVSLEDESIGMQLEDAIGITAQCFGHHNSHQERLKKYKMFRQKFLKAVNNTKSS